MTIPKRGMVFGVFDGLHPGHRYLLDEASKHCEQLVVVVTRSEVVELLKNRKPKWGDIERMQNIRDFNPSLIVVLGDEVLGSWNILRMHQSDIIFLGYDQQGIAVELQKKKIKYVYLDAHKPEQYKSSLLS